jgi:tetratricopeptide (TPR) repeat protein
MAKRVRTRPAQADGKPVRPERRSAAPAASPAPVITWPAAAPLPPAPAADAVAIFQSGMESLQRKQYRAAAEQFRTLLERFAGERALLDRARVYLDLCDRELQRKPANPCTVEERITAATAALNNDDDEGAEKLAKAVLSEHPDHDLALYLLAAVESRRNAVRRALDLLSRAIGISPEAGQQARYDPDFDALHDSEEFWRMVDKRQAQASRRPRRRIER